MKPTKQNEQKDKVDDILKMNFNNIEVNILSEINYEFNNMYSLCV